jgi:starch synthase (maltosyl-transferring)
MQLRNIEFHHTDDNAILAFSKHLAAEHSPNGNADTIIVVVNVDPHSVRETTVHIDPTKFGLPADASYEVHDLMTDQKWVWGRDNYVRLDSFVESAHVLHVTKIVKG